MRGVTSDRSLCSLLVQVLLIISLLSEDEDDDGTIWSPFVCLFVKRIIKKWSVDFYMKFGIIGSAFGPEKSRIKCYKRLRLWLGLVLRLELAHLLLNVWRGGGMRSTESVCPIVRVLCFPVGPSPHTGVMTVISDRAEVQVIQVVRNTCVKTWAFVVFSAESSARSALRLCEKSRRLQWQVCVQSR